jgi:hypothetical protein
MNSSLSLRRNVAPGIARIDKQEFERFYRKYMQAPHAEPHSKVEWDFRERLSPENRAALR